MTPTTPNLMTLLSWAERLAAGERCAEWEAWCASSPAVAAQWEQITRAQEMLDGGAAANPDAAIDAEELAELIEGRLDPVAAQPVEQVCWQSDAQLAEAISGVRFQNKSPLGDVSPSLEQRLLTLGPKPQNGHANGASGKLNVPDPLRKTIESAAAAPAAIEPRKPDIRPVLSAFPLATRWQWALAAAALFVVVSVSATLGWLVATSQYARHDQRPVVPSPVTPLPVPPQQPNEERPREERPADSSGEGVAPANPPPAATDLPPKEPAPQPPGSVSERPAPSVRPRPPAVIPKQPRAVPPLPPPPEITCRSVQGMLLVDASGAGRWRALQGPFVLREPAKIVSLAESWSTLEIPQFGTLIWDGPAEATLTIRADGLVEIHLSQGKVGLQGLAAGAQVQFETSGANWTARSLESGSTFAVIDDPLTPAMLFVKGAIGVEDLTFGPKQIVRWQEGVPAPVASSSGAADSLPAPVPALGNPWDLAWLQPPDDVRNKRWRGLYGRLVIGLAAAEDVQGELKKLLAANKDARQAALLGQWSLALADEAGRTRQNWDMLNDRRELVRIAGVKSLVQLPPGDPRHANMLRQIRQAVDQPTSDRVAQWLAGARQPAPLPVAQAAELADHLQHSDLAVRQIAVSILELHTAPAFIQARLVPPAYDAAGPPAARADAQMTWRQILRQLYTAAAARNAAGALAPMKPIPQQPGVNPNAVAPNAAPGGT